MSRIAGIVTFGAERPIGDLSNMAAAQSAPGWQSHSLAFGVSSFSWCGKGTPRLAAAAQLLVAMDGSIYNAAAFSRTHTPAQIIAERYRQVGGEKLAEDLNGDFAVALYDGAQETLWLIRDRFGVKPLYWIQTATGYAFASRLVALTPFSREIDRNFVGRYAGLHYRYFDADLVTTPYREIKQVQPGTVVRLSSRGATSRRYWHLREMPAWTGSEHQIAGELRELLRDAVATRLTAAHRPAFTLSGGLDSASVLALAVDITGEQQAAFSTGYQDQTYDESAEIQPMLSHTSPWHRLAVDDVDVVEEVTAMIAANDEPVATATWLAHWRLAQAVAAKGFSSLFGGLGGDELNAGEYEYFFYFFADLAAAGEQQRLDREIAAWAKYHDHPIWHKDRAVAEEAMARLVDLARPGTCVSDARRLTRYAHALNPDFFSVQDFVPVMDHPFSSYLHSRAYQDLTMETIPCCLRANDRQTTAFGLDSFLPFLDHRLVEFMFRVESTTKINDGVTKHMLREAMRGILPEETRSRIKKMGWNAPAHQWFAGSGRQILSDIVGSARWRQRGIYNVGEVEKIIAEHDAIVSSRKAIENHMMFLWQLLNLELWLQAVEQP